MGAVEAAHSISNLTDEISMATREQAIGIDRIIDALLDERRTAGEIHLAKLDVATRNVSCGHDCSLQETLAIGRALGMELPEDRDIHLLAIVAGNVTTFSEQLTPAVEAALGEACDRVCMLLSETKIKNR